MSTALSLNEILSQMGAAGRRLDHMGAVEAGAGNISVCVAKGAEELGLADRLPQVHPSTDLPLPAPALAGRTVLVTGSGCRLRDVAESPEANVSAFVVDEGGLTGTWYTHPTKAYARPTSEFNSHLAVHDDQVSQRGVGFQAVIHAQPPYLVQLSHIKEIRNTRDLNRRILRWEPETIVQLPQGIEVLDFMVPGGQELMENNVRALRDHVIVLWSKHGIMVRSDVSPLAAVDKVEYAETGAMYEVRNIQSGNLGEGVTDDELRAVIAAFNVPTDLF
ncbi:MULTISPECIES: class II aldolase/adducin family protein [unclassified Actinomyces]|uniref:class II aldolase/adducin family protein n=1 Tax=unclassified Actinomyces TaxID=2609248 RepID=UPI002017AF76|nr:MULTISPECIES: class II aldolase/adducin family protein [unclassified Actinomyces]MCL3777416.1 class II aldolase/adducin family protein [Actinomyces sp. AC-20-1]MCL3790787.1 class II aldolase/adducin family protein [Actinomyces sp. 187325]MCL3792102.1 class II aldolase/adducin family protein [Actinomyces sp. 186855]MCL3793863.1 class II aldolase/adducin family protein [Actinomyces sp. 217892]